MASPRSRIRMAAAAGLAAVLALAALASEGKVLRFAAEMARDGNWREARYRWQQAVAENPDNPRVLNNLAVAQEVLGEADAARRHYESALQVEPGNTAITENYGSFRRFQESELGEGFDPGASFLVPDPNASKKIKKSVRVEVPLVLPPRLDISSFRTVLVADFLGREIDLLDTDRELARYLRREMSKKSALEILGVTPPPAIPEQTLQDLQRNDAFWKFLGKEHGADLIVSGQVDFDRRDVSGFEDVDYVSDVTGQKIRQTRFVEKEQFGYVVTLLFFDGRTGSLLYRDQLKRSVTYRGLSNDPITAFYELSEMIARDVLAVVSPRKRIETRWIFDR